MKFSQVSQAAQVVNLLKKVEELVAVIDMDPLKKAKVQATVAKMKTDFMDGANIEPDVA